MREDRFSVTRILSYFTLWKNQSTNQICGLSLDSRTEVDSRTLIRFYDTATRIITSSSYDTATRTITSSSFGDDSLLLATSFINMTHLNNTPFLMHNRTPS